MPPGMLRSRGASVSFSLWFLLLFIEKSRRFHLRRDFADGPGRGTLSSALPSHDDRFENGRAWNGGRGCRPQTGHRLLFAALSAGLQICPRPPKQGRRQADRFPGIDRKNRSRYSQSRKVRPSQCRRSFPLYSRSLRQIGPYDAQTIFFRVFPNRVRIAKQYPDLASFEYIVRDPGHRIRNNHVFRVGVHKRLLVNVCQ